ncbi:TonB-dependent receptor [Mucilaginibacter flavidus]|uniref:TonB-dependent receptor n=1 Tax=Mucilaginibacter flavidus TaxID=2949309 RepID=UPI002092AC39|nr:carboxypeptidase-like regulatory domain-containing protein [Mucilaginibacter flavidus]MCO5950859.1 TonB-dependent receptor [Mucilaginibacter flavidus]
MNRILLFIAACLFTCIAKGQVISGKVTNIKKQPLAGVSVYWLDTAIRTATDTTGLFQIALSGKLPGKLVFSLDNYEPDTLQVTGNFLLEIRLKKVKGLNEVRVTGQRPGTFISSLFAQKMEIITPLELKKAACCDLAGCFETQASVDPQTTNAVTNSKELRLLGISGIYNQVLIDGMPLIQGLSYTYGISSIPGTLVDNIFVSKGANSVIQGFESISGQINVETKEPDKADKLNLNLYVNNFAEKQFNADYAYKKYRWSNVLAFHTTQPANKIDQDKDTFLDVPLLTRYMLFDKLKYGNETDWGWSSMVGVGYLHEQRIGGQINFNAARDEGTMNAYGQVVNISQPEVWTKTGYRFNDNEKLTFIGSSFYQDQNSYFGTTKYLANQTSAYANFQYELLYNGKHSLITGISYRDLMLNENIAFNTNPLNPTFAGEYRKNEQIPGFFAENTLNWGNGKIGWLTGVRLDHDNQFGFYFTPRTLLKYELSKNATLRASVGTGWRTVNLFSENVNLLASSRNIVFAEPLKSEKAVNYGLNFTQKFETQNLEGYLSADFYRTSFQSQVFMDYDTDPTKVIISNFIGTSASNSFQAEAYAMFFKVFELKVAYNYLDVYHIVNGNHVELPFNSTNKVLTTVSYKPVSGSWHIDFNAHWYGKQQLPDTHLNPVEYQRPDQSIPYYIFNGQFTKTWKQFEVYTGCENIFGFRQNQPIIGWQYPFGKYFDTSSVWGPTRGREIYIGVRFKII